MSPNEKHTTANAAVPPMPTPASSAGPRWPTSSVSTSVMMLYDSVETVIGHASVKSSPSGLCSHFRDFGFRLPFPLPCAHPREK